jgi:hypothetical protein
VRQGSRPDAVATQVRDVTTASGRELGKREVAEMQLSNARLAFIKIA